MWVQGAGFVAGRQNIHINNTFIIICPFSTCVGQIRLCNYIIHLSHLRQMSGRTVTSLGVTDIFYQRQSYPQGSIFTASTFFPFHKSSIINAYLLAHLAACVNYNIYNQTLTSPSPSSQHLSKSLYARS